MAKYLKSLIAVTAVLSVGGCSTFSNMETGLNTLIGQPLDAAIARIGYPSGQMQVGNDTVYAWGRQFSMNMPRYNQATTTGRVGGTGFSATTGYTSYDNVTYECNVKIITDERGIIKTWEFDGNIGGCDAYSKRLKISK